MLHPGAARGNVSLTILGPHGHFKKSDWEALYVNLRKAQWQWWMMTKVMTKIGVKLRAWAMMYNVVVHTVILYGSKSWVVTEVMLKVMEGFHHWVAQRISGMSYRHGGGMGVVIYGEGLVDEGAVANEGVYSESAEYHCGIYYKSPHLLTVHGGRTDAGIEQVYAVLGPGY